MALTDPYKVLGISHSASDAEIRAAYRHQVQLHHPDHNGGSAESARRFEQVQEAYALIRRLDRARPADGSSRRAAPSPPRSGAGDPRMEQRLAEMERDLAAQRAAKQEAVRRAERLRADALRQAREAAGGTGERASDEDLGYVSTDDSFSAIVDDAAAAWSKRFSESAAASKSGSESGGAPAREPVNERVADLFDDLGSRLRGDRHRRDED